MLFSVFILFKILTVGFGYYVQMTEHSINIQTGTTTLTSFTFVGSTIDPQFTLTFSKQFISSPKIMTNFRGLQNCYSSKSQFVVLNNNIVNSSLNHFTLRASVYLVDGYDPSIVIKIYYLISQAKNSYISMGTIKRYDQSIPNYTYTFSNGLTSARQEQFPSASTYLNCFLNGIFCRQTNTLFTFKNQCTKVGKTAISYTTQTTANSVCPRYDICFSYLIILDRSTKYSITHGTLTATTASSPALSFPLPQAKSIFVIGLASLQTNDGCLKFELKNNNMEVDATSYFIQLDFNYVLLNYSIPEPRPAILSTQLYPFTGKAGFTFQSLNFYQLYYPPTPLDAISFSSTLKFIFYSNGTNYLSTDIISPVTQSQIYWEFYLIGSINNYKAEIRRKLISSKMMKMNVNNRTLSVYLCNTDQRSTSSNFSFSFIGFSRKDVINLQQSKTIVQFQFSKQASIGQIFYFYYRNFEHNYNKTLLYLPFITITQIVISIKSQNCIVQIEGIPDSQLATESSFRLISNHVSNNNIIKKETNLVQLSVDQDYSVINKQSVEIVYRTSLPDFYQVYFQFNILAIQSIEISSVDKLCKIKYSNFKYNSVLTEFQIQSTRNLNVLSIQSNIDQKYQILTIDYTNFYTEDQFSIKYTPQNSLLTYVVKNLKINQRFINMTTDDDNVLTINFRNLQNLTGLPEKMQVLNTMLQIINITNIGDEIQIKAANDQFLNGTYLSIVFDLDSSTYYHEIINLQLCTVVCAGQYQKQYQQYYYAAFVIVILYWITFITGLIFCQKIYAVEIIFALQFAFMTYIPIKSYCSPFTSFKTFHYSFGWNGISFDVQQAPLNLFYSSLGFTSNIISNINFMLLPFIICPLLSIMFLFLGKFSKGYRAKPRLLALSKSLLLDIPFTFTLINESNIVCSVIINFQTFKTLNISTIIVSCVLCCVLFGQLIIFGSLRRYFVEYRQQFCDTKQLCKISMQKSASIRKQYPFILFFEILTLSVTLSLKELVNFSLYISLGLLVFFSLVKVLISPYSHSIDNVRLFIHQFLLICINGVQIGFKIMRQQKQQNQSTINLYPWTIFVLLIIILVGCTLPYLVYKITRWLKSKSLIDVSLYNREHAVPIKPIYKKQSLNKPIYYPALQYSMFKKYKNAEGNIRQQLLDVEKINKNNEGNEQAKHQVNWETLVI